MKARCVALLGRRDEPTDAVEEYCQFLGAALEAQGISFEIERVSWHELGWRKALAGMEQRTENWKKGWVLIQYTALAWSRRGFPFGFLNLVRLFREHGVRCGVVVHDARPYDGSRLVDRVRRRVQVRTMREVVRLAHLAVLTIPREKVQWLSASAQNVVFIPVGANLPSPERVWTKGKSSQERPPTVAVFSLSAGRHRTEEACTILDGDAYVERHDGHVPRVRVGRQ